MRLISNKKIDEFKNKLRENSIDAALFLCSEPIHDINIEYFTGFQQIRYHSFSCLLLTQDKTILIVSPLDYERAQKEAEVDELIKLDKISLSKILKEKLRAFSTIGIIENLFPYKLFRRLSKFRFKDIANITFEIRAVKEEKEIERIKKACRIANRGVKFIKQNLSAKITEKEMSLILEQEMMRDGADGLAFPTFVASGKRSGFIHPCPTASNQKIQNGLGLIDFGVVFKGYCSDVTVPFIMGDASENQRKIVKAVKDAYREAIDGLKIGMPTWKLHETANKIIAKNGFEFKHSLGHGLGLEVHDSPSISPKPKGRKELKKWRESVLKENMVFTIEPGVYVPNIGGCRIENDILMTKRGPKILTKSRLIDI